MARHNIEHSYKLAPMPIVALLRRLFWWKKIEQIDAQNIWMMNHFSKLFP